MENGPVVLDEIGQIDVVLEKTPISPLCMDKGNIIRVYSLPDNAIEPNEKEPSKEFQVFARYPDLESELRRPDVGYALHPELFQLGVPYVYSYHIFVAVDRKKGATKVHEYLIGKENGELYLEGPHIWPREDYFASL